MVVVGVSLIAMVGLKLRQWFRVQWGAQCKQQGQPAKAVHHQNRSVGPRLGGQNSKRCKIEDKEICPFRY